MSLPLYSIRDVHFGYEWNRQKVDVLKGVHLEVAPASFVCIVGPSGTGKTTLLNLMGFLNHPDKGSIKFGEQEVSSITESTAEKMRLRELGFVFQSFHLIPTLTALENTAYFLYTLGWSSARAREAAKETLVRVGLGEHAMKYPGELSGGQRQRVAIARALAKRPKVVLADEPTANLDRGTAEEIIGVFKQLQNEGTAFIFATHDQHLVSRSDRAFSLLDGKIVEAKS